MRYHVVSLVAVFLALGIGILLGSNTNFLNVQKLIKMQDSMIKKLENTQKELSAEKRESAGRMQEEEDYIRQLEEKSIPLLMDHRLTGVSVGVVSIGDFAPDAINDGIVTKLLGDADATVAFRVKIQLAKLEQHAAAYQGDFAGDFAAGLIQGAAASGDVTSKLIEDGSVVDGGFDRGAQAIVFVLGDNVDPALVKKLIFPLENAIMNRQGGTVANVALGKPDAEGAAFGDGGFPLIQNIETIPSQAEFVSFLSKNIEVQSERFNPATDMAPTPEGKGKK